MSSEQLTQEVKEWLRRKKKNTDWLGSLLCVKGGTVRGWFSCRPIPRRYHARLRELMSGDVADHLEQDDFHVPAELVRALRCRAPIEEFEPLLSDFLRDISFRAISSLYRAAHAPSPYPPPPDGDLMAAEDE